jgi:hypothetical protein
MLVALGASTVVVAAAAATIWLARSGDGSARDAATIDERTGAYRGVRFGASEEEVIRLFGQPERDDGFAPADKSPADVGVPQALPGAGRLLKYENVVFLVAPERGVYAFMVTEAGARTRRGGVSIGDRMDAARERHRLGCRQVAGGESLLGEQEFYPSCETRVATVRVWFGRDPIRSITLLSENHLRQ